MTPTHSLTDTEVEQLLTQAKAAREGSYSPYSKFRVGCAFLLPDGSHLTGANVECASYGGTICAERTALVKGVSQGKKEFRALAVSADIDEVCSPCGICRQFIREFCSLDMPVYMVPSSHDPSNPTKQGTKPVTTRTLGELLPLSFGPDELELPRQ